MLLRIYKRAIVWLAILCFTVYIRKFEVHGRENVPLEGPLILASNHLNNADPPALVRCVPRYPMFMAKREMITWPILGPAFRIFGAFPVRRGAADLSAIRAASEVLQQGNMLVMFPEGTRSRTGGLTKGHPGTALIALRTKVPVLPVAVTGTQDIPFPWIFLRPLSVKHVTVTFGKPFTLPHVDRPDSEAAAEATTIIMSKIAELLPAEYRGVYAHGAPDASVTTAATSYEATQS